jgi:arabinosyltransferase B
MTQVLIDNARESADEVKVTRWVATIAGLLGFVLAVITPLLPVVQTTATLNWPQNGELKSVAAPLISLTPVSMNATVPCEVIRGMPAKGGMVLGLAPQKAKDASLNSLFVTVDSEQVAITDRNVVIASVPRDKVEAPECQRIEITSTEAGTFATFVGVAPDPEDAAEEDEDSPQTGYDDLRSGFKDPNLRPGIVGVFTDLTGPAPPGLSVSATIDTRFTTRPTALKLAAMLLAIAATVVAVVALWRLDRLDGHRMRRWIPQRWRRLTSVDVTVTLAFLVWYVIGANSSDDGYILGMARVADQAGYMSNYFRWFGVSEDPFGWYYNVLALMTHVSTASIWIRLPDLVCGFICWLLLSREVLPRLGPAVAASRPA